MKKPVRISTEIAPHFHKTFKSKKVHQIDYGGRGSTKTTKNAFKIVYHVTTDDNCNVVVIRRHKNSLRQSVLAEIRKAFKRLGFREGVHFTVTVAPMKLTYLANGNTIYFGGLTYWLTLNLFNSVDTLT